MKLQDIDTGEVYATESTEDGETVLLRNGPSGLFRPRGPRGPNPRGPRTPPGPRTPRGPRNPFPGGTNPRPPIIVRPHGPGQYDPGPGPLQDHGEFVTIKKSALVELAPAVGKAWAAVLARPEPPAATGDNIIDRDNASMHRDALALHQQNQTRILALTDLLARAAKLLM